MDTIGYPKFIELGMYNNKLFIGGTADSNNNLLWEYIGVNEYLINYPANMECGFHYFVHRHNHNQLKVRKDYSKSLSSE